MIKKAGILAALTAVFSFGASFAGADTAILHERAKNLYDVYDYRAALNLCEQILALDPGDGIAWDLSAWCLRYLGEKARAVEFYKKALTLLSGEDAAWPSIGLGEIYLDGQHYEEAASFFQEALKAAAENREVTERASRGLEMARNEMAKRPQTDPPKLTDVKDRQRFDDLADEDAAPAAERNDSADASLQEDQPLKVPPEKKGKAEKSTAGKSKRSAKSKPPEAKTGEAAQPPVRQAKVYGILLGAPIEEALAELRERGCKVAKPFLKDGKAYYALQGISVVWPPSLDGALYERCYISAYRDAVLSVIVERDYDRPFEDLKETIFKELPVLAGQDDTKGVKSSSSVFGCELRLAVSRAHGLWSSVTDKLNGTCRLEIEHIDLVTLSYYWMAGGQ
ncbi:MAG: hypothetical protein LBO82_10475 [Synergistaceae bacterium]|nr:hypothetical protein [Synergistaceae bacterium]